ncbi:MAG: RNHCP domain-containing protein [bacterium]|nr:RNHCP domain-containing protein [bacterium]
MTLQTRKFTAINEAFACLNCGKQVEKTKSSYRNHCPFCLCSQHVDVFPGDRLENCHGIMTAVGLTQKHNEWIITHRCRTCDKEQNNKVAIDDSKDELLRLFAPNKRN